MIADPSATGVDRTLNNTARYAVGIDFGGTSVKLALVDDAGAIHAQRKIPTADLPDQASWLDAMAQGVSELAAEGPESPPVTLAGVGIGVPGFVDHRRGFIHDLPNVPGWTGVPLAGRMEERVNLPVMVDNDVNAMATGECIHGAGRAYQHVVFLTLGTGVGGALLLHNRIYRGARSMAGEIGHMTIDLHGIQTPTGQGGLEQYVGNQRIVERALRYLDEGRPSILDTLCHGERSAIGPQMIEQAAEQGDELSIAVYDEVADCLAAGLASVAYLIQPQAFIIGGGVGQSGPILYGPLRKHLRERLSPHFADFIVIKKAALGNDAGVIGAATLVLQN